MRLLLIVLQLCWCTFALAQQRPYGATWLCNSESQIIGSVLGDRIYDTEQNLRYTLRQGQTYSTRVGKYGGSPLGASRCSQLELFDTLGNGKGCAQRTWTGLVVYSYDGQPVWQTCQQR